MKIWIFNHYANTPQNGNLTRHYDFAGCLRKDGHDVTIFTSSAIHNSDKNEITDGRLFLEKDEGGRQYVYVKTRGYAGNGVSRVLNMLDFYRGLLKTVKYFEEPDVIYASSPHLLALSAGLKAAKRLGVPCVCEVRDLWPLSVVEYSNRLTDKNPLIRILYGMEKRIYQKADALIFTMAGGADYIREQKWADGFDFGRVYHINNGVDLERFDTCKKTMISDAVLDSLGGFKVVYAGAMRTANEIGRIVECAALLRDRNPDISFVLYGSGGDKEALSADCEVRGLANVFFRDPVAKTDVPGILCRADLCILNYKATPLSRYGTSQNKLFEYMASGRPILSTIRLGYSLIAEYSCGRELGDSSAVAMADAVLALAALSPAERAAMGQNARRAAEDYDTCRLARKLEDVLLDTAERYRGTYNA